MSLKKEIKEIESILNYKFTKKQNLIVALTHPSIYKDKKKIKTNNISEFERLEFLGDRVLGLSIATLLFNKFKNFDEGNLTKKFSYLVQRDFLYKIALELELDKILNYSDKNISNRISKSILSDAVESLIGGIFIDGGFNASMKFIKSKWEKYLDLKESNEQDPKTKLQELSQQKYKILPEYSLIKKSGPSHSPTFIISLKALKIPKITATGKSIREAEKKAAIKVLKLFNAK
tara:strand:- start:109 stop:807 length:699 start_codon:yes stop_codon:yes gene_type:complete